MDPTTSSQHQAADGSPARRVSPGRWGMRVALYYILFGFAWILISDFLLELLVSGRSQAHLVQTLKGLMYVLGSGVLVFTLARKAANTIRARVLEDQLEATEQLMETVLAHLGEAVMLIDPETRVITRCNRAVLPVFGFEPEELTGKCVEALHRNHDAFVEFGRAFEAELGRNGIYRRQYQLRRKDGRIIDTEITVLTQHEELGWKEGIISIVRDISTRVQALDALAKSEERYRLLAENTLDVIWSTDRNLVINYINPAIRKLTGHAPEECIGRALSDFAPEDAFREMEKIIGDEVSLGTDSKGRVVKTRLLTKDGGEVQVEIHGNLLFDDKGDFRGLQGSTRDIGERLALEARVRQAQKLESLGTLAGGVAHEINNPIMGITGFADLIRTEVEEGSPIHDYAASIRRETERVHTLVRNLLGFARKEKEAPPKPEHMCEIVENTLSLIRTLIRHDAIELEVSVPEDLPPVICHSQRIQQVVMNLLTNARDAVNARYPEADPNKKILLRAQAFDRAGSVWVRTTIEDRGFGIPEEVRERMFDPFYTTKPEEKGTGLGLWILYGIVKDHGGNITVETEPGSHTRIHVDLPAEIAMATGGSPDANEGCRPRPPSPQRVSP